MSVEEFAPAERFDLVVCAEALYYLAHAGEALKRILALGSRVLMTYTRSEKARMDELVTRSRIVLGRDFAFRASWLPPRGRGCRMLVVEPTETPLPKADDEMRATSALAE